MTLFERYVGIDYSGASSPTSSLPGLRVSLATPWTGPVEVPPPHSPRKYWTRRGVAQWLGGELAGDVATLVGIDHGFSFPLAYFEKYKLERDWPAFLDDFQHHWPCDGDHVCVDFVRYGSHGHGAARVGSSKWRRLAEIRTDAKSVFHFDVPGSVAKSTHAGLPWLRHLRQQLGARLHFWPFDGWGPSGGRSVIVEVYPSLWKGLFPVPNLTGDQQDAFSVAAWMQREDRAGALPAHFNPRLSDQDREIAEIEGWILGLGGEDLKKERRRKKSEDAKSDRPREVAEIVILWRAVGQNVTALHSLKWDLSLGQIHSALAYYHDNQNVVDEVIAKV